MSRIGNETRRALLDIERGLDYPTITWNSREFICTPYSNAIGKLLTGAGYASTGMTGFIVRSELFRNVDDVLILPQVSNSITGINGDALVVSNVNISADGVFVYIEAVDKSYKA